VPVTGFFEFREVNSKKYPYLIRMIDGRVFSLAGIYEDRTYPSGSVERTFSIVTSEANELMSKVHNTKLRMPVILNRKDERTWLDPNSQRDELEDLMRPYGEKDLEAFPVSRIISGIDEDSNIRKVLDRVDYPELNFLDLDSFAQ
jgi:putative SOS response-associated peptidase YedK